MRLEVAARKRCFDSDDQLGCAALLGVEFQRLAVRLLVPHQSAEIATVYLLRANGARIEMLFPVRSCGLPGMGGPRLAILAMPDRTRRSGKSSGKACLLPDGPLAFFVPYIRGFH